MKNIPLGHGKFSVVDDSDYDLVAQFSWSIKNNARTQYAQAHLPMINGERSNIFMHRLLMSPNKGQDVDHRDGDGLNNQRENLRLCTRSQNLQNMRPLRTKTGFKGVRVIKRTYNLRKPFLAEITVNRKLVHLGYYSNPEEAAVVYNQAAINAFGEFARLNIL